MPPEPFTETQPFEADPIAELLGSETIRARGSYRSSLRADLLQRPPALPAQGPAAQAGLRGPLLTGLVGLGLLLGGLLVWRDLYPNPHRPSPASRALPASGLEDADAASAGDAGAFDLRREPPAPDARVDEGRGAEPADEAGSNPASAPAGQPAPRILLPLPSATAAAPTTAPVSPPDPKAKSRPNTPVPPPLTPVEPTYEIPDPGPTATPHVAAGRPTRTPLATPTGDSP